MKYLTALSAVPLCASICAFEPVEQVLLYQQSEYIEYLNFRQIGNTGV